MRESSPATERVAAVLACVVLVLVRGVRQVVIDMQRGRRRARIATPLVTVVVVISVVVAPTQKLRTGSLCS